MNLVEKFEEFLKSNNSKFETETTNSTLYILKAPYNDKIDILYGTHRRNDMLYEIGMQLAYYGIYDKVKNKVFDPDSNISYHIFRYEPDDIRLVDRHILHGQIMDEVNDKIKEHLANEPEMFDYSNVEIELSDEDIYYEFMDGKSSEHYEGYIKNYITNSLVDIFEYLSYGDTFVDETARDFIVSNIEELLKNLKTNDAKQKLLKEVENNKEHPYHKQKAIKDSVKDKDYKTVNLTINKNGIEQTIKYETKPILYSNNSLYTGRIVNVDDRKKFEENYGRSANINFDDIIKITYGKKNIYEDKNFIVKDYEDENVFTR